MILINGFAIDAAISESHDFESEVTDNPVEAGSDVTDNVRIKGDMLRVECIVSDTPLGQMVRKRGFDTGAFILPSDDTYSTLKAIREKREPVTVETELQVYENMVLQSLSIPRDSGTGGCLKFTATFKQIQFVTNRRATQRVAVPRAKKKVARGNKASPDTTLPEAKKPPAIFVRTGSMLDDLM